MYSFWLQKIENTANYTRLNSKIVHKSIKKLYSYFKDYQVVVLGTDAGLGHLRMSSEVTKFWQSLGIKVYSVTFNYSDLNSLDKSTKLGSFGSLIYEFVQKSFFGYYVQLIFDLLPVKVVNLLQSTWVNSDALLAKLLNSGIDIKNKTLYISTHPLPTINLLNIFNNKNYKYNKKSYITEYVTDPGWVKNSISVMTSPTGIGKNKHITCVHNIQTQKRLINHFSSDNKTVIPWGTPSPHQYLFNNDPTPIWNSNEQLVILIEWSGTHFKKFDIKIEKFVKANIDQIKTKKLKIIMHTATHKNSYYNMKKFLKKHKLLNKNLVQILYNKNREDASYERDLIILGKSKYKVPHCSIVKAGEQSIQDNGNHVRFCVYTSLPHEKRNALSGECEHRAKLLTNVSPQNWLNEIKNNLNAIQSKTSPTSLALLAPIKLINHGLSVKLTQFAVK